MHGVVGDGGGFDGGERSGAHVQGDGVDGDAPVFEVLEDGEGEVEPGGGASNRTRRGGVDGLVPVAVLGMGCGRIASDVRGERGESDFVEEREEVSGEFELEQAMALIVFLEDGGVEFWGGGIGAEDESGVGADPSAGFEHDPPFFRGIFLEQKHFYFSTGIGFSTKEASGEDFRIIDDEDVAGLEEGGEVGEREVFPGFFGPGKVEKF